jgi:hypothetical protein
VWWREGGAGLWPQRTLFGRALEPMAPVTLPLGDRQRPRAMTHPDIILLSHGLFHGPAGQIRKRNGNAFLLGHLPERGGQRASWFSLRPELTETAAAIVSS